MERVYNLCYILVFCIFSLCNLEAYMMHQRSIEEEWRQENIPAFDELMLSWNAPRPQKGGYLFYVSVKTKEWSPWLLYAAWGSEGQKGFSSSTLEAPVRVYQDAVEVLGGERGTAFQIKVVCEGDALLSSIHGLHVYTNGDKIQEIDPCISFAPISLPLTGLSQMVLNHARYRDLCSPVSTTAVVRYLLGDSALDPTAFAQSVWDSGFDIYGNWVFNVAQAAVELGPKWNCWVERLSGFEAIYQSLHQGIPVIVSVRGPLEGSALAYAQGHLMVVVGYDSEEKKVMCMDPAFSSNQQTAVAYDLSDFVRAWSRRGKIAYLFTPNMR